jgi:fibronectin type 3 domain-containing protein
MTLQPGQTGQATMAVTSADSAVPGSYGLNVLVSDLAGSTHNNSGAAGYTVLESPGDNDPPTAPTGLSASLKLKHVNISWNAATDDVEVTGYRIWRNGTLLDEITVAGYVDRAISPGEIYNYHVVAFDAAGNVSDSSNSVVVSVPDKTNSGKGKPKK